MAHHNLLSEVAIIVKHPLVEQKLIAMEEKHAYFREPFLELPTNG